MNIFVLEQTLIYCLRENPWKSLGDFPWRVQERERSPCTRAPPCCFVNVNGGRGVVGDGCVVFLASGCIVMLFG